MEQQQSKHLVITIGRTYGSGGREIGRRVAQQLGIPFYDNELIAMAAEKAGVHPDIAAKSEEHATSGMLFGMPNGNLPIQAPSLGAMTTPLTDRVFFAQSDIIRGLADKEDCVIIGRCADYVLREYENVIKVFIHADAETCVARCVRYYGLDEATARKRIRKVDQQRAGYYTYYSGQKWGSKQSYDLLLDTGRFGVDGCAAIICAAAEAAKAGKSEE